jgi:hypothetical protein
MAANKKPKAPWAGMDAATFDATFEFGIQVLHMPKISEDESGAELYHLIITWKRRDTGALVAWTDCPSAAGGTLFELFEDAHIQVGRVVAAMDNPGEWVVEADDVADLEIQPGWEQIPEGAS